MADKTWYEASQINFGLVMRGIRPPQAYSPDDFFPPYSGFHQSLLDKETITADDLKNGLYTAWSPSDLDAALHAVASLNGSSIDVDWPAILRQARSKYEISDELEKVGRSGKKGNLPDILPLIGKLRSFSVNATTGLQSSRDIDWQSAKGLQKSGWDAIDLTVGGIAESGPIIAFAATKTGKSFWTFKLLSEYLNYYPEKTAAVFSLEMASDRQLKRSFEMYPKLLKPHEEGRLFITHKTRTIEGITADVSTKECDIVVIDGVDGMVKGDYSAGTFARAWSGIIELGVVMEIPVVVTAQPNRTGKWLANKTFLERYSIEWSGGAENAAEQLFALQHIQFASDFEDTRFPVFDDTYYMISWLQREGWREAQDGPGAVIFRPDEAEYINGSRVLWGGQAYGQSMNGKNAPTLWRVGAGKPVGGYKSNRIKKRDED